MKVVAFFLLCVLSISTIASPKDDVQQLVDYVLPFAKNQLASHGEFYPFGAKLNEAGKVEPAMADIGQEHPASSELIDALHAAFSVEAKSGRIRASALVYDVRVAAPGSNEKSDAIEIELEHQDGYNVFMYVPYSIENGIVSFRDPFTTKGPRHVFAK